MQRSTNLLFHLALALTLYVAMDSYTTFSQIFRRKKLNFNL